MVIYQITPDNNCQRLLRPGDGLAVGEPFGVYVHWPFCMAKCPYCDFNSYVAPGSIDYRKMVAGYCQEIAWSRATHGHQTVTSIYFGGGTPSLMPVEMVEEILAAIGQAWPIASEAEITLEANPTSSEASRFAGYQNAGINRLSIGVQALDDDALRQLGRCHSVGEALKAVELARTIFPEISFDLIYARSRQTLSQWCDELTMALSYGLDHLSLYQLTIEQGTGFFKRHRQGKLPMPSQELSADFYRLTQQICADHGMPAYEVSNHCKPGCQSRHNLVYWRGDPFVGIGPGAHGRLGEFSERLAVVSESNPQRWLSRIKSFGHGYIEIAKLNHQQQADELLLMGLRLREGLSLRRYCQLASMPLCAKKVEQLIKRRLIEPGYDDTLRVTSRGLLVLNSIIVELACESDKN